ncbi:M48 family metallopeptidase [Streptomyces sp. NPDC058525]|uniref:M48 family metallopeptidase n=1 Tax=Streptomyces sp. NPDC058525 TaxID=3346538 RepID=UPI00366377A7
MSVVARALLAIALLVGYLVTAAVLVFGLVLAAVLILNERVDGAGLKALAFALLVGTAVVVSVWRALLHRPPVHTGVTVDRSTAPDLWEMVDALCARLRCRAPDELRLVPEANAYMYEPRRLLGLLGGRRYLYIGAGLLVGLTSDQLRFILAHELGHHAHGDSRLAGLTYACWEAIEDAVRGAGVPWGVLLNGYHWLYRRVSLSVLRYQEHLADLNAAALTGKDTAVGALRRAHALDEAWWLFVQQYAAVTVDGVPLTGVTEGFKGFLQHSVSAPSQGSSTHAAKASPWDTHPLLEERIGVIEAAGSDSSRRPADHRPATALTPFLGRYDEALDAQTLRTVRTVRTPGTPFPDHAVRVARERAQRRANALYRCAGRVLGNPQARLGDVLDLLAAGRAGDLAALLKCARISVAPVRNTAFELREHLRDAMALAAENSGAAHWACTPQGPEPIGRQGPLEFTGWAGTAVTHPEKACPA